MANRLGTGQSLDNSLPTVFAEFKLLRDEIGIARSTATTMRLKAHTGTSVNVNNYDRVVAYDVADAADITQAQDLADTTTSYTPGEVAVQVILPGSTMRRTADPQLLGRTGRMMANAYDLKEDSDGVSQYTSFTPIRGVAGTVISPGHVAAAAAGLRIGSNTANPEPAPKPWFLVLHPNTGVPLLGRLVPYGDNPDGNVGYGVEGGAHAGVGVATGTNSMSAGIVRDLWSAEGRLSGAIVKYDANLALSSGGDASGAMYSKEGFIYVSEVEAHPDHDRSDKSMRDAVELNIWGSYVWGLYRSGAYGVEMLFDASTPTS